MPTNNYLPTEYQNFIHVSRYARWLEKEKRREIWPETVSRYFDFFTEHLLENNNYTLTKELREELEEAILNLEIMPSMRALMTAGKALKKENIAGYNCCYVAIDDPRAFDEIVYILMNGTGVGYSVERRYVEKLPRISDEFYDTETTIVVKDSKLGWAKAYKELIHLLYSGQIPKWDDSKVRPAGAPLKTFGGRASGPGPLKELYEFAIKTFRNAAGRRLTSLECSDLVCKSAEIVVVGGVRRSALICLSDIDDDLMRRYKMGNFWDSHPERFLANISFVADGEIDTGTFMREWLALYDSKCGERGVFSRTASKVQALKSGRRKIDGFEFGTNPCCEIILRNMEFCNLTEVMVREFDTPETLKNKVRLATILGTFQATLTNFRYIRKGYKENCEEERLLGVSLTGIMDNKITSSQNSEVKNILLTTLQDIAIKTNETYSSAIGIPQSAAITCVKPSGTVSQLTDCRSGIHGGHSRWYIRTVRADIKDPLAKMMVEVGFPSEHDVTKPNNTLVFSFPIKCPDSTVMRDDLTAIQQLENALDYQRFYCEHKPSITVSVKEHEWMEVGAWVFAHMKEVSGVSFLPFDGGSYKQAPYQECSKEYYEAFLEDMPRNVDWTQLSNYELSDHTVGTQELSCAAGFCEIT